MKATTLPVSSGLILPLLLGIVSAVVVYAALTGRQIPFVSGPRAALLVLLIVGMAVCGMGGIGQVSASGKWASPLAILGYLIGTALFVVFIGAFAGWKLPLIAGEKQAVLAVAVLMAAKYAIGTLGYLFHLL